jgi:hypothetical protein
MTDQWNEVLRCPQCRNTGVANLSQLKDADTPTVDSVSDSFKAVQTEYGPTSIAGPATFRRCRKATPPQLAESFIQPVVCF